MGTDVQDRALSSSAAASRRTGRDYLEALLVAVVMALFARTFLVQAFRVPSDSMAPSLVAGDQVLVNKFLFRGRGPWLPGRSVRRSDVVVFRLPGDPNEVLLKRCVALGGESVELRDGRLFVEGRVLDEPWLDGGGSTRGAVVDPFGPLQVPPGHLFCLGDNREDSRDSRAFGTVPERNLLGRPLLVYWSSSPAPPVVTGEGVFARSRLGSYCREVLAALRPRTERLLAWAT